MDVQEKVLQDVGTSEFYFILNAPHGNWECTTFIFLSSYTYHFECFSEITDMRLG